MYCSAHTPTTNAADAEVIPVDSETRLVLWMVFSGAARRARQGELGVCLRLHRAIMRVEIKTS